VHLPSFVNLIPFPPHFMKTLTYSWRPSWTSSTHLLPLALYHMIWRLLLSNLCWKSHHLTKIFLKTTAPFLTFHFCPKSLKKVVFHKPLSSLQENNLSNPFQSACWAGHSTETILLHILNSILSALDNDNISVPLLDLSAAFDTNDHQVLLFCLNSVFGILSTVFQWFQSYLSEISPLQWVTHHHHSSCTVCLRAHY